MRQWIDAAWAIALSVTCVSMTCSSTAAQAADWRQFRGPASRAVSPETDVPTVLSGEKIAWTAELPGRGLSGPIVVGDRVFLTCSTGFRQDRLHVLCFDANSGKQLWERQFWATGRTACHDKMCNATPTPASDGERIVASFSSNDVVCLDRDGKLLWFRGLTYDHPNASNSLGMSSSPLIVDDTVVIQVETDDESFATGLNLQDGTPRWRIERPRRANWTSPAVLTGGDDRSALVLLQSSAGIDAVRPRTGDVVWSYTDGAATIPSSTTAGNVAYVPSNGLTALKTDASGQQMEVAWNSSRLSPSTASPVVVGDRVYNVNRAGVLACASADDGEVKWQLRLKGPYSSTPIAAGGYLYFFNEDGFAQIVKAGEESGEIVSEMDFAETILCTPALANGALYVRSDGHLWKITR